MELYQLRTFVAVAEEGNFTRAGKRVHATQPAVSAHIKSLEEELGVRLFDRVARGVELTPAGAELVQDALDVLAAAQALEARAVTLGGEVSGSLAIGLCTDPEYLKTIALVTKVGDQFPRLNLKLAQLPSGVILNEIRARNLHAGFVFSGNPYQDLESIKLAEPELSVMGGVQHRKILETGSIEELSAMTWGLPTSASPFRDLMLQIFNDFGMTPAKTIGVDTEEVMRSLIVEGHALCVVREDEAVRLKASGQGVECTVFGRHRMEVNFVYRKGGTADPSVAALIETVRRTWGVE